MALVIGAQLLVPLLLVALIAFGVRRRAAAVFGLVATGLYLAGVARIGLWTTLPGWTTWILAVAAALAAIPSARRRRVRSSTARWLQPVVLAAFALAAIAGLVALGEATSSGRLPPQPRAALAWPLEPGTYRIANGGSRAATNGHLRTLDPAVPRYRRWRGQSFGVDIVALDRFGLRASGWRPSDPSAYVIFGRRVLAPCDGVVVAAETDAPDMRVPDVDRERMLGNHVVLRCGEFDVAMAHLKHGSVSVARGERVRTGTVLGRVGNSGNSDEPHLHLHAQRHGSPDAPVAAEPVPVLVAGRVPVRNDVWRVAEPPANALPAGTAPASRPTD